MLPSMAHLTLNTANAMVNAAPKRAATSAIGPVDQVDLVDLVDLVDATVHIIHNMDNAAKFQSNIENWFRDMRNAEAFQVKVENWSQNVNVVFHNATTKYEEFAPLMYGGTVLLLCRFPLSPAFLRGVYEMAKSGQWPIPVSNLVVLTPHESGWSVEKYRFGQQYWVGWSSIAQRQHPMIFENLVQLANENFRVPTTTPTADESVSRQRLF